jgi:SAM-dependent methyltransferase
VCDAAHVPLADRSFCGILCLDVLEHVTNERAVLAETARLLKPGSTLVLTVPQCGLLAGLDSLNLFGRLVHATRRGLFPPGIAATGCHRHYAVDDLAVDDLRALVGDAFTLVRVRRTGLGVAELVHLPASCSSAGSYRSNHFTPGRRSRTIRCTFSKMSFRSARLDTTCCWSPGAPRRRA